MYITSLRKFSCSPGLSDLAQGEEYLKDSDILDHITPTLPVDGDYVPPALSEIDPAIFVVYSDPGNLAPIANTIVHCEVELGGEVYTSSQTCQVSPSHRLTPRSGSHDFSSPLDGERNESSRRDSTNSTLPEGTFKFKISHLLLNWVSFVFVLFVKSSLVDIPGKTTCRH